MMTVFAVLMMVSACTMPAFAKIWNQSAPKTQTTMPASNVKGNDVWVGTFQLVWNDFSDKIVKSPIVFEDGPSKLAQELNKKNFTADMLSENSYYKAYGEKNLKLKEEIEKNLMDKFGEKSALLEQIDWNSGKGYLVYAMLKKEFKFPAPFPELASEPFARSKEKVRYFGIGKSTTTPGLGLNTDVLFYNYPGDYALKLKTKQGDEIILYKTNSNKSFEELFATVEKKQKKFNGDKDIMHDDLVKIPYIKFSTQMSFDELCNRKIKGTNGMFIEKALQTVDFGLDNKGGNLKSEALVISTMSLMSREGGRKFFFDGPFVLFMKESNQDKPYFALRIKNDNLLEKAVEKK